LTTGRIRHFIEEGAGEMHDVGLASWSGNVNDEEAVPSFGMAAVRLDAFAFVQSCSTI
jgi:hypothetical protein